MTSSDRCCQREAFKTATRAGKHQILQNNSNNNGATTLTTTEVTEQAETFSLGWRRLIPFPDAVPPSSQEVETVARNLNSDSLESGCLERGHGHRVLRSLGLATVRSIDGELLIEAHDYMPRDISDSDSEKSVIFIFSRDCIPLRPLWTTTVDSTSEPC